MKQPGKENIAGKRNPIDPYLVDLLKHAGLSLRAKKIISENISSLRDLLELSKDKLALFPNCGAQTSREIMDLVESLDPAVVNSLGLSIPPADERFDDRLVTLADSPSRQKDLNRLPIFSGSKRNYCSEEALHFFYKGNHKISDLPLSSRIKRYLNSMEFATLGQILITPWPELLKYRYFKKNDLMELQKGISVFLWGQQTSVEQMTSASLRDQSSVSKSVGPRTDGDSLSDRVQLNKLNISGQRTSAVIHAQNTSVPQTPTSSFPELISLEKHVIDQRLRGTATTKINPEAGIHTCDRCDKLVWIIQKMLSDKVERVALVLFTGMLTRYCRENCVNGLSDPMIDRGFVARLLARHRGFYEIKGNNVVSKECLKKAGQTKINQFTKSNDQPASNIEPKFREPGKTCPRIGADCSHPVYGDGVIIRVRNSTAEVCVRFGKERRWVPAGEIQGEIGTVPPSEPAFASEQKTSGEALGNSDSRNGREKPSEDLESASSNKTPHSETIVSEYLTSAEPPKQLAKGVACHHPKYGLGSIVKVLFEGDYLWIKFKNDGIERCLGTDEVSFPKNNSLMDDILKPSIHLEENLKGVEPGIESEHTSNSAIDPEDVIAWLVTQPNANGTLYLESVVRQYMSALRAAPKKLQIPIIYRDRSVFTCNTPDELNAFWNRFRAAPNYKQVNSSTSGMFSAGMGCLLRYLDHLSSTKNTVSYRPLISQSAVDVWNDNIKRTFQKWLIGAANYSPKTAQIYVGAVSRTVRSFRQIAEAASSTSDTRAKAVHRFVALLADDSDFIDANKRGHKQLSAALSAFERFIASESIDTISEEAKIITSPEANPHEPVNAGRAPLFLEQLTYVLSSHFANGYRLNSPIEMARFRAFAAENLDEELTLTDEELKSCIAACGTNIDGKVYVVSERAKERIKEMAEDYFADGAQAIFFAEFYAKNENWLFEANVVSEDILIDILRGLFPKLSFTQTYFGYTDVSAFAALEREILRAWGDDVLLTYGQLSERLRYIPLERIKSLLGQNGDFIWSRVETFSHVSRIGITAQERQLIRETAERECNAHGYASITDLPLGEIEERHYELSITAVHNAVYRICLSDKFDKKGKIVARKGNVVDALTIMQKFCQTLDKCSLDDLLTYQKEITGEVHHWIPMEAGNAVLVRIDKCTYVADRYVHFNTGVIDEAIGLFVKGDYLPLKSFTTFGAFPDCGQTWNLFLLESYCRRFSRKFRFDTLTVNSRNAGAVIRKSCGMDYTEIMTDAVVANADIPLQDTAVGKFLYESGYTGRSTTAKVNEIIEKAKAIREMRD